jgi:hypothetical protein
MIRFWFFFLEYDHDQDVQEAKHVMEVVLTAIGKCTDSIAVKFQAAILSSETSLTPYQVRGVVRWFFLKKFLVRELFIYFVSYADCHCLERFWYGA